jgi:uncharacterized protein
MMPKVIRFGIIGLVLHMLMCVGLYCFQEKLLFHPNPLPLGHVYLQLPEAEEIFITLEDGVRMHGLYAKTKEQASKGLLLYLHGNAGSSSSWSRVIPTYLDLGYDVFLPDYRSYGKSEGRITSQKQFLADVQICYDAMKESDIGKMKSWYWVIQWVQAQQPILLPIIRCQNSYCKLRTTA